MLKDSNTVIPYDEIDYEIRNLVRYLNDIKGIETLESCSGHGDKPCLIWFKADDITCVTKFIGDYIHNNRNWRVTFDLSEIDIDNGQWENPTYLLETTLEHNHYVGLAIDNLTYKLRETTDETDN